MGSGTDWQTRMWQRISEQVSGLAEAGAEFLQRLFTGGCETAPERTAAFTMAVVALGAKMAKADGVVVGVEVEAFDRVFAHDPSEAQNVHRLFDLAKQDVAGYEAYARRIAHLLSGHDRLRDMVLESLFHIATADRALHPAEDAFLARVAEIFGLTSTAYRHLRAQFVVDPDSPYDVLGLTPRASEAEIRARHRCLVRENHPDVLAGAGVPQDLLVVADRKVAAINAAFDAIAAERGFKRGMPATADQ